MINKYQSFKNYAYKMHDVLIKIRDEYEKRYKVCINIIFFISLIIILFFSYSLSIKYMFYVTLSFFIACVIIKLIYYIIRNKINNDIQKLFLKKYC